MGIKSLLRCLLKKVVYPLSNLIYETFHKRYVIISTSVKPLKYNWGDDVSVVLCSLINPKNKYIPRKYTWNVFGREDILCIGSIITWLTTSRSIIWGSGVVYPNKDIPAKPKKVLAVRGPLTRAYLLRQGVECPEVYGDPALLFPRYYQPQNEKKYKLGIIPHFRDKNNPILERFKTEEDVLIIDVEAVYPWTKFIDDISSCDCIASSSLHGIIVSDAYGVPNIWVEFDEGERKEFAFRDYLYSVGKTDVAPVVINPDYCMADLIDKCLSWRPITIDIDRLINVCPFAE